MGCGFCACPARLGWLFDRLFTRRGRLGGEDVRGYALAGLADPADRREYLHLLAVTVENLQQYAGPVGFDLEAGLLRFDHEDHLAGVDRAVGADVR